MGFSPKLPSELQQVGVPTATVRLRQLRIAQELGGKDLGWVFMVSPHPEPKLWFLCHLASPITQELTKNSTLKYIF